MALAAPLRAGTPGTREGFIRQRAHHEDRVTEGVDQIERASAPELVLRRAFDRHPLLPLLIVRVGIIDTQRNARLPAVAGHRTVDGELDTVALETDESVPAIVAPFPGDVKTELVDIELLR